MQGFWVAQRFQLVFLLVLRQLSRQKSGPRLRFQLKSNRSFLADTLYIIYMVLNQFGENGVLGK